jgi:hypothetical protein
VVPQPRLRRRPGRRRDFVFDIAAGIAITLMGFGVASVLARRRRPRLAGRPAMRAATA